MMKVGLVGMPNAGKSSLFNALSQAGAEAANYPFTTIEPNVATVPVKDPRMEQVAATVGASNIVWDTIEFHDIAGLARQVQRRRSRALPARAIDGARTRRRRDGAPLLQAR